MLHMSQCLSVATTCEFGRPANESSLYYLVYFSLVMEAWWHCPSLPLIRIVNSHVEQFTNSPLIQLNFCPFQLCWNPAMDQDI